MDDAAVSALEADIAALGTLLVQAEKFRASEGAEGRALRAHALAIGDRARRAHRRGTLEPALADALAADVRAARAALAAWLARTREAPAYRAAVEALKSGDRDALATALVEVFEGLEIVPLPPIVYRAIAWQRRGRPRPADDIATDLEAALVDGLPGDDDCEAHGLDPGLPGVLLSRTPPPGEPIHLAINGATLPLGVVTVIATGDVIVPGGRLRVPFRAVLAPPDDDADAWVLDPAAFHRDLRRALHAHHVPVAGSS